MWRYPHGDELIASDLQQIEAVIAIAENLGCSPMSGARYRELLGLS